MSINPTVPIKTPLYRSDDPQAALPMDKAWHGFFEATAKGLGRLDDHDSMLAWLIGRRNSKYPAIIRDLHSKRVLQAPAKDFDLWYETDRTVWYMAQGGIWVYWSGTYSDILSNIPTDLINANDTGFQFFATNYAHTWFWDTGAYHFATWESSGYVVASANGSAPTGGVWHACDGATVSISKASGANAANLVQSVTLPDLTGNVMIMGGTLARSAATAYLSQTILYQVDVTSVTVPQVLAPNETNGGMPLRIGLTFYVRQ